MGKWVIWYKDEPVGFVWFTSNVDDEDMFYFASQQGINVSFFMEA